MVISPSLATQLARLDIPYNIIHHRYSDSSLNAANSAHIPASKMVKSVILEDERGYVMAHIPANQHLKIRELNSYLNRKLGLATEAELNRLFTDCDEGSIPPIGDAYGMETVVDDKLDECNNVYIEAGNHTNLLHISGPSFRKLMNHAHHAPICVH